MMAATVVPQQQRHHQQQHATPSLAFRKSSGNASSAVNTAVPAAHTRHTSFHSSSHAASKGAASRRSLATSLPFSAEESGPFQTTAAEAVSVPGLDPLATHTPLHTFSALLQQTQQRTYSLFVNNVGLKPPPFLPASEEKIKLKLFDEYYFPPVLPLRGTTTPHQEEQQQEQLTNGDRPTSTLPPLFASACANESAATAQRELQGCKNAFPVALAAPTSSQSGALSNVTIQKSDEAATASVKPLIMSRLDMSFSDLLAELSAHTATASLATTTIPTAAGVGGGQQPTAIAAAGGEGIAHATAAAVSKNNFALKGELAGLRLRNLPAALRPTWHRPWKLHRVIAGHLGWVTCIAVDPTNDWFATGSNDRLIKIWDLASGTLKLSLTGHVSALRDIKLSNRHPYMFTCGEDNRVKCWDLEHNKVVRDYHGHLSGVYTLALHPQLDVLCSGGRDAVVRVWDMRTKQEIYVLSGHTGTIMSLQMQSLEPHIISGSQDKMIRLWDLAAGKCSAVLTNHKKSIRALAFHPNEYSFVSCAADKVKIWRCPLGKFERNIDGHNAIINCCAIKEETDSSVLIAGTNNGQLHFWDWASGYKFDTIQSRVQSGSLESENGIFCCVLDKSETRLLTGECDKTIKVWKPDEDATEESHPLQWKAQRSFKRY